MTPAQTVPTDQPTSRKRPWGLSLLLSILVLMVEAAIALVASALYTMTQQQWVTSPTGGSPLFVVLLPFLLLFAVVVAAALSMGLVLPTAWLGDVLGRRVGGRAAWWGVPVVAGVASLVAVGLVAAPSGGSGVGSFALGWVLTAAALAVPALLWRSRRKRVFGPVLLWGVAAVVLTAVLGGVGFWTGALQMYRPPNLPRAALVGTWSDDRGGTLTLAADGRATLSGPGGTHREDGDGGKSCGGDGTWDYGPGTHRDMRGVEVDVPGCGWTVWNVGGFEDQPTLFRLVTGSDEAESFQQHELTKDEAR
ncbi:MULTISPECIES: hypothetical protein [Streptomyces]|uniref:hypothetical protein n=1 Tax=Streptomyces TaxID=1883 RepID=UPI001F29C840|nr:hypothetical protein [Streptomyces violaceoruber]